MPGLNAEPGISHYPLRIATFENWFDTQALRESFV